MLKKQVLPVTSFNGVIAGNGIRFQLVKGAEKVEIEAEENLLPYFETKVSEGELSIKVKEGYKLRPSEDKTINVTVSFQNLSVVKSYDGAYITMKDTVQTDQLRVDVHAGANANILVNAREVRAEAHSGSDLVISGTCDKLDAHAFAAGDVKAFNLICRETASANTHSGSNIELTALGVVNASAHSGADVRIKGNPKKVNGNSHSGGSISEIYDRRSN